MYKIKSNLVFMLLGFLVSSIYAAHPIAGKTVLFFNHWEHDGNRLTDGQTPQIGGGLGSWGNGINMVNDNGDWWKYTFPDPGQWGPTDFTFQIKGSNNTVLDVVGTGSSAADFAGADTIYAGFDPVTGGVSFSVNPPKEIHFLNPWPTSAPAISVDGSAPKAMYINKSFCGWYIYRVFGDGQISVSFSDVNYGDSYGLNGLDDATPIDLRSHFSSANYAYITPRPLPTGKPEVTDSYPADNPLGDCFYKMAAIIRDFNSKHPNFQGSNNDADMAAQNCGYLTVLKGMVEPTINTANNERKPVATSKGLHMCNNSEFDDWFRDKTDGIPTKDYNNRKTCIDLEMSKTPDGLWEIDSRNSDNMGFWPIDGFHVNDEAETFPGEFYREVPFEFIKGLGEHNFHFCMETHAKFKYRPGQKFSFAGDDDVWVFINDKLVVDLGGIHIAMDADVDLDTLGLVDGEEYMFDFFLCERQATGSNMKIKTSIFFEQLKGLFTTKVGEDANGNPIYKVQKVEDSGEGGNCASLESDGPTIIENPNLEFNLVGNAGFDTLLTAGQLHFGGINITAENLYSVNLEALSGLAPGSYQLIIRDADQPSITYVVRISIPGNISIQNTNDESGLAGADPIAVIIQNERDGTVIQEAVPYFLSFGAGLKAFLDPEMTQPADLANLVLNANGLDTIYVWTDRSLASNTTYTVSVVDGVGDPKKVTFEVPQVRFVDASNQPLTTFDLGKYTYLPNRVRAELYYSGGTCVVCAGDTIRFSHDDSLQFNFKETSNGVNMDYAIVNDQGFVEFYVVSLQEVVDASFTITGASATTTATYTDITLVNPPVPLIKLAIISDENGDGIPDKIVATYNKPIVSELPEKFSYFWPDTTNRTVIDPTTLASYLDGDSTLVFTGDVVDSIITYGQGVIISTYTFEGTEFEIPFDIQDGIAPVIAAAKLYIQSTRDLLTIEFSEPMDRASANSDVVWYEFIKTRNNTGVTTLQNRKDPISADGMISTVSFDPDVEVDLRAVVGDSVRISFEKNFAGLLKDLAGNYASDESIFVPITGDLRIELGVYKDVISKDPTKEKESKIEAHAIPLGSNIEDVVEQYGNAGVIVPFSAIQSYLDEAGLYEVRLRIETNVFTNLGGFVKHEELTIGCDDEFFNGNCRKGSNQKDIFVDWNYKDETNRAVGSGVYVVQTLVKIDRKVQTSTSGWSNRKTIENYEKRGFSRVGK